MDRQQRYYYNMMTRPEQSAYDAMLPGFEALSQSIRVPRLPGRGLGDVFFRLKLDNPRVFYVTGCNYRWAEGAEYAELIPDYMFDRPRVREHQRAVDARLEKLVRPALELGEPEKEKYIHDFICANVRYDKLKKNYSHEIIGPLQNGVGVCEGIAKTVKLMCDRLGVECVVAVSEADPDSGTDYLHAWNVVKLGGKYYHLDVTFDNTLGRCGMARYDYFNLDDAHIFRDHRPLLFPAPACTDGDRFYYRLSRQSLTKVEEAASRAAQAIKKKRDGMVFHWRGGYLTREKLMELVAAIDGAAAEKGRGVQYSVNWPQAVIKLTFTEPDSVVHIETECADEAEGET